jgi:hypothetical protein
VWPVTDQSTIDLLHHLAAKPGHDEVKADFRQLLIYEFGAELSALDFERRVPEVHGRLDALIGRTILEANIRGPRVTSASNPCHSCWMNTRSACG